MKERRRQVLQEHTIQMVQRRSLWSSSLVCVGIGTLVLLVPVLFSPPAVASEGRSAPKDCPRVGRGGRLLPPQEGMEGKEESCFMQRQECQPLHGSDHQQITLGMHEQTGVPLNVSQEALESGMYILGVPGVGKSTLLLDLILQKMQQQQESVIVFDPHGDLVQALLARMPTPAVRRTSLFDLKEARDWPFGINLFALPKGQERSRAARDRIIQQVLSICEQWWPELATDRTVGLVLRPLIATLMEQPALTLAHVPRLFADVQWRTYYTADLCHPEVQAFWEGYEQWPWSKRARLLEPVLDRITLLLSDELVRQILCQRRPLDLAGMLASKQHLLLSFPVHDPAYTNAAKILSPVLLTLLRGALFRGFSQHRPGCTLVIDEWHQFATREHETLLAEGRKYRVTSILAHQYLGQLEHAPHPTSMKAAATSTSMMLFRANREDACSLAPLFAEHATASQMAEQLNRLENRHAWVKVQSEVFPMTIRDVNEVFAPASVAETHQRRWQILERTKERYCQGRREVEKEIACVFERDAPPASSAEAWFSPQQRVEHAPSGKAYFQM